MAATEKGVSLGDFVKELEKHKADAVQQRKYREQAEKRAADAIDAAKHAGQEAEKARKQLEEAKQHQATVENAHRRVADKAADRDNVAAALTEALSELKEQKKAAEKAASTAEWALAELAVAKATVSTLEKQVSAGAGASGKYQALVAALEDKAAVEARIKKLI